MVADFLAKEGTGSVSFDFIGDSYDKGRFCGLLCTDSLGLTLYSVKIELLSGLYKIVLGLYFF